jgi:hypothetical protein
MSTTTLRYARYLLTTLVAIGFGRFDYPLTTN